MKKVYLLIMIFKIKSDRSKLFKRVMASTVKVTQRLIFFIFSKIYLADTQFASKRKTRIEVFII